MILSTRGLLALLPLLQWDKRQFLLLPRLLAPRFLLLWVKHHFLLLAFLRARLLLRPDSRLERQLPTSTILGCISGTVREDTNNDNSGDVVLPWRRDYSVYPCWCFCRFEVVPIAPGSMSFAICSPGSYVVLEINLPGYADVSDTEGANDNSIRVPLGSGSNWLAMILSTRGLLALLPLTPVGQMAVPTSASPCWHPGSYCCGSNTIS
jgi:hypothetical protein